MYTQAEVNQMMKHTILNNAKEHYTAEEGIEALSEKIFALEADAQREGRELNREEKSVIAEMKGAIKAMEKEVPGKPLTVENGPVGASRGSASSGSFRLRGPAEPKDHKALFGTGGYKWPDKETGFFNAVFSGRHHPGLIQNATMTESVPSDGGFAVPTETARQIHNVSLENELVMPRAFVQPMTSNEQKLPAMEIGSHSTALMGGFTASYVEETGTISENNPKLRGMTLNAKKLTGLIRFSNELVADLPNGEGQIINLCGQGLSWYRDKSFLKGSGAGQPLGILNADCTIEVSAQVGQDSGTIVYENLTNMLARLFAGSFKNSVWVAHQSTIPQLLQLSIAVGTGGSHIPVMTETNGQFQMLTRPVIFTEKTETLGTKGDIMLADFSQYAVGLRQGMRFDTSIHAAFLTDELYARLIERHDGQPLWDEPLTLEDGSTTVSPFVVLEAR